MKHLNGHRRTARATRAARDPRSLADFNKRRVSEIIQYERAEREKGDKAERVIQRITRFSGSIPFISINAAWFVLWILLNTVAPARFRWDPFPFTLLTLVVSLEAIFLSAFILLTENREAAVAERRMHLDLQVNLLAERETTKILVLLEGIAAHLGVGPPEDAETKALEANTEPSQILAEIDQCLKKNGD